MDALNRIEDARLTQMMKELQSDMADLVASGDLTEEQANEWVNAKAEQWKDGRG
jgi:polyhydroxyalkanoate synthesis regulator phasin